MPHASVSAFLPVLQSQAGFQGWWREQREKGQAHGECAADPNSIPGTRCVTSQEGLPEAEPDTNLSTTGYGAQIKQSPPNLVLNLHPKKHFFNLFFFF